LLREQGSEIVNLSEATHVAALIDHTLLKADATRDDVLALCSEARQARFASVCVNPCWVPLAAQALEDSPVKVCTVVGFPLGANRSGTKLAEAELALVERARELDMVINIGALRSGYTDLVLREIRGLAGLAHSSGVILKVILETSLLTDLQKELACALCADAGADFVKTSTGFSTGGATAADVALLRRCVGDRLGVKASGGIRTLAALREMVEAGANRIGTSSGVSILRELTGEPVAATGHASAY
jgi:deoxyribose-phosphate aldolase